MLILHSTLYLLTQSMSQRRAAMIITYAAELATHRDRVHVCERLALMLRLLSIRDVDETRARSAAERERKKIRAPWSKYEARSPMPVDQRDQNPHRSGLRDNTRVHYKYKVTHALIRRHEKSTSHKL